MPEYLVVNDKYLTKCVPDDHNLNVPPLSGVIEIYESEIENNSDTFELGLVANPNASLIINDKRPTFGWAL